ncbi:hypothetical protein N7468_009335 [Penicillium chermesinum]|uniref:Uncharacterized protein n=1 Tax=Penicillium chermesinum TaxID=63820 RepID=A0A9W9TEW2_9EURO|nr:uncharacterized protein N7468_009335 [Penicillium chermesinum]KAJ5220131.1 hypothetical protein N7468_009335 [Penicillium chermesinum]
MKGRTTSKFVSQDRYPKLCIPRLQGYRGPDRRASPASIETPKSMICSHWIPRVDHGTSLSASLAASGRISTSDPYPPNQTAEPSTWP